MFKNRALKLSVIKDDETATTESILPKVTIEDVDRIAKNVVKYVAIGTVAVVGAIIAMDTASQVTVNHFKETPKED